MNLKLLINELTKKGASLWVEGERLRFRAPKESLSQKELETLKKYKTEIIRLLEEEGETTGFPLSHGQRGLWFLAQLAPESAAYNIVHAACLRPDVESETLKRSLDLLARRHPVLRTRFSTRNGEPYQVTQKEPNLGWTVIDASAWDRTRLEAWLDQQADIPFELAKDPILRLHLLTGVSSQAEESVTRPVLVMTTHHIAFDFWSLEVFLSDLETFYQALASGKKPSLSSLKWRYQDFVAWESQLLAGPEGVQLWAYWKERLGGELPVLNLPLDRQRPPVQTYRGASMPMDLGEQLSRRIRELSQATGVTPFMTLLTTLQVILMRYSGQDDILVGSPAAGRDRREFEALYGYFVNMMVLRGDLAGNPTFKELLGRTRETVLGALEHQQFPFQLLVERLQPERDPSCPPIFQVAFVLDRIRDRAKRPGLFRGTLRSGQRGAAFDLKLLVEDDGAGIKGSWEYNTDLFDEGTVQRLAKHFEVLLNNVLVDPDRPLSELSLLTPDEQHKLLETPATAAAVRADRCVHEWFEEQVEKTPGAVAVVFEGKKLTYTELNTQANQLAHTLRDQGVGPEVIVGICMERSLDLITGLLGILKAGGAYLPLDLASPPERLAFMIEDAKAPILLTQRKLASHLPKNNARLLCFDQLDLPKTGHNPERRARPDNLAYVIYTSGSTGKPKGVSVTHYNVVRLFQTTQDWFHFNEKDVWTLFHSYAFDFSVWEIWGALFFGGRVVVVPQVVTRSPDAFYQLLKKEGVTVLNQTPSAFHQLMQTEERLEEAPELSLKWVIFGGEALELSGLRPWFDRHGDERPRLVNMYGITETTVHVTYRPVRMKDLFELRYRSDSRLEELAHRNGHRTTVYTLELLGRANSRASVKYRPQPYDGSVVLFSAEKQPRWWPRKPNLGWGDLVRGKLTTDVVPGYQQNLLREPNVRLVAEKLTAHLEEALRHPGERLRRNEGS